MSEQQQQKQMTPDQLQWVLDHNMQIRAGHRVQIADAVTAWRKTEADLSRLEADNARLREWKNVILDMAVVNGAYRAKHEDDPRAALSAVVAAEISYALDPQISKDANALRDTYLVRAEAAESKLSALIASVREIAEKSKAEANAATETAKEAESKRMYVTSADQLARAVVHQELAEALLSALQQSIGDK